MGRRLGLIIGVNEYQDTLFRTLQFAENDARALSQWLVHDQGGKWSSTDVQLVRGAQATAGMVGSLINHICVNMAMPGDLVLIYFAGHAFVNETSGEGYLALADTRYHRPDTGLNLLSLARQSIAQSQATNVVFMLDSFQSGPAWSQLRTTPYDSKPVLGTTLLNALQQGAGRLFFCSCRGNELASESGERNLGLLTHRMILSLSGAASDPATGQVSLQRLHTFLFSALGEQHRPQLFGKEQGPVILVGNTSTTDLNLANISPSASAILSPASATLPKPGTATGALSPTAYPATATAQLSPQLGPSTSGMLPVSVEEQQREQQITMLLRQAKHLIQMNNSGEAFHLVEQALQLEPENTAALILKSQLLGSVGRFQEALPLVEHVVHLEPENALAWSVGAALLTNTGQLQDALFAVEHSLELDPQNPETYAIKTSIMEKIANGQSNGKAQQSQASFKTKQGRAGGGGWAITGIQAGSLLIGTLGAALPMLVPGLPLLISLLLESLGLAILCVNAGRGTYLLGIKQLFSTLVFSLLAGGIAGGAYYFEYSRHTIEGLHYRDILTHQWLLVPAFLFLGWLILATALPLLSAIGGLIGRLIIGMIQRRR